MKTTSCDWIEFWDSQSVYKEENWQAHMEYFLRLTLPILNYNIRDTILDIGCGPGLLANYLKNKVKEIHLADTSEQFLHLCRKKYAQENNVFCYKLDPNQYTDLSAFPPEKFSLIICLSVIQYYRSIDEVEQLIKEVQRIALPGAKFLIGDIPAKTGTFSDIYHFLKQTALNKCLTQAVRLLFRYRFSSYRQIRNSNQLLFLSDQCLKNLVNKLGLNAELLETPITFNENRKHLLISF